MVNGSGTYIENYTSGNVSLTAGETVNYVFNSIDHGGNVAVTEMFRPSRSKQMIRRTPTNIGLAGDRAGNFCFDNSYIYVCVGDYDGASYIWKKTALSAV